MSEAKGTEARILDAAHTVFLRQGTAGARMQQIADEAGVNKALLHYYFDDKDTLAREVFVRAAREFLPSVIRVLASDASLEEKVKRVVELEIDRLAEHPFVPGYVLAELHSQPGRARSLIEAVLDDAAETLVPGVLQSLEGQLRERARTGDIRYVPPEQFVVNLIALCVFPFAMRPMISALLGVDEDAFPGFLETRKRILPELVMRGLQP